MNVFITGASSGIGAALAGLYIERGATVGIYARHAAAPADINPADVARCVIYPGDVRDPEVLAAAARDFQARFGVCDIVIANAGISQGTLTEEAGDLPAFRAVFDTNVLGMVNTFQPFLAAMQAQKKGTLVGIASVAGFRGLPGSGAYSASKSAAITYLESLRVERHGSGISVVTICPGYIATPMTRSNPYSMPFLLAPERAAQLIARAIAARRRFYVLPWQMALVGSVLRCLPRPLYDFIFARAPRKPRRPV